MRYLLDTNICVRFLNGRSPGIRERLLSARAEDIVLCSVVKGELHFLVTNNLREFSRVDGLEIADWEQHED